MADESIIVDLKTQGVKDLVDSLGLASKGLSELDKTLANANKELATLDKGSQEFKNLTKEINAANTATKAYNESTDTLKKDLRDTTNEIGQLERALKELEKTGQKNTQVYKDIAQKQDELKKKAGQLKDTVQDLNAEIKNSGSDTKNLDKALRAIGAVAAGYQIAQGALALFGSENKKFEQALLKLNAVMAITNGLQQIQNELSKKDSLFTVAATKAKALYTIVVGESVGALKLFKVALAATGIGLAIVAIVALYQNWDKLKEAIFGSTQSLEDFRKKQEEIRTANKQSFDDYETEIRYLVNIKKLTQEAADLKLSIKRKEAEESLKAVYDENTKKLQEYEQAIRNITFAKDDGITMSELEYVRSQQKYIPSQKELTEQKRITREAELDYKKAVNDRIEADEKGVVVSKKVVQSNKEIVKSIEEIDLIGLQYSVNSERYLQDQIALYTELRSTLDIGTESYIALGEVIEALKKKLAGKQKVEPIDFSDALGGINPKNIIKRPLTLWERIFGSREENVEEEKRIMNHAKGALKIVSELNSYGQQISSIAEQAIQIRTQNELQLLEDKKNRGLITEKEYEKQSAQIKNEAARKKRAIDIANATAQIPVAVLSAYIAGLQIGGLAAPIIAGILAGVAGAFGIAQVALIASAPLPKFRDGGSVAKRLGLIKGKKHEQGGVPIEVEGDEYVMPVKETRENLEVLQAIHKGKFKELFIPKANLIQPDIFANIPNPAMIDKPLLMDKDDYSSINTRLDKVANELWWLRHEAKTGNKISEKGTDRVVKAVQSKSKRYV